MPEEKTEWTERIKKVGEKMFTLGNRHYHAGDSMVDQTGNACDDLLAAAREMDKEIARLNNILGTKATKESIEEALLAYGNAYIFKGRLLNPADLAIRRVTVDEDGAMAVVRDLHAMYFENGKPVGPPTDVEGVIADGTKMLEIVRRAQKLVGEAPCASDSATSSTGDRPSTRAKE